MKRNKDLYWEKKNGVIRFRLGDWFGFSSTKDLPHFLFLSSTHKKGAWKARAESRIGIGDLGVGVDFSKINADISPLLLFFNPDGFKA